MKYTLSKREDKRYTGEVIWVITNEQTKFIMGVYTCEKHAKSRLKRLNSPSRNRN